jgi:competence protein ComEC
VATVGLAPLSLLFFHQVSVVGFVANLLAIPLVTLLITPLSLLGMLVPPLWQAAAWLVQALSTGLQQLASLPWALWTSAVPPLWAVACGLLAGLVAVLPLPWRLRALALPLMLPMLLPPLSRPGVGQFELVAADVGQGTAVLVRTRGHLLVFDTGPAYSPDADAGARILLPLLRARGEQRVDLLMLSHRDSDHVGGAASLLATFPVAAMSSSLSPDHPLLQATRSTQTAKLEQEPPLHKRCDAGERWTWDGVHFEVLHPLPAEHATAPKPNAASCVLKVQGSQTSALLTGDIEAAQEAALVQRSRPALRADVLQVPHHGSRTSSTAAFIDAVAPRAAFVQAAYRSRFGHPAPDVVARYEQRGAEVIRSDRCGAWTLSAQGAASCERQRSRRYWHHPPAARPHE